MGFGVISIELTCRNCAWRTVCGRIDAIDRLRSIGLLRRDPDPANELIAELMLSSAGRFACPVCRQSELSAKPATEAPDGNDDDWQAAVLCEICRQPIPPARLEALPGAKRCLKCQEHAETGQAAVDDVEYCPHCGALVEIRVGGGRGITHYKRFCTGDPPCRL